MLNIKLKEESAPAPPAWVVSQDGTLWTLTLEDGFALVVAGGSFVAQLRNRSGQTFLLHASEGHVDVPGAIEAAERWLLDWTHKLSNTVQILRHYRASYAAHADRVVKQVLDGRDDTRGGR